MYSLISKLISLVLFILFFCSCSTNYIKKENFNNQDNKLNNPLQSNVYYNISNDFFENEPNCILILPIESDIKNKDLILASNTDSFDKIIRKSIYAHLSALNYKDIELSRIDYLINKYNIKNFNKFWDLANELDCNSLLQIRINKFSYTYLGIYSSIDISIDLKLISSNTKKLIWESSLSELKAKGSFPISPLSIASGLYSATNNLREENIFAVADNISRKLLKKLPNPKMQKQKNYLELMLSEKLKTKNIKKIETLEYPNSHEEFQYYISKSQFDNKKFFKIYYDLINKNGANEKSTYIFSDLLFQNGLYEKSLELIFEFELTGESNAQLNFLKGKIYYNMDNYPKAEKNIIKAISQEPESLNYLNALGIVYIKQNKISLANASFTKALNISPDDVKANKIIGIINFNLKRYNDAAYYFTNSAITSYENKDYINLANNIVLLEKIEKINSNAVNKNIMKKLYIALERRTQKND